MTRPPAALVAWKAGEPLRPEWVGSTVHFRRRGKYVEGIIERVGPDSRKVVVRVGERMYWFSRFYRDGRDVWITGQKGYSRTHLYPGTRAEWRQLYEETMGKTLPDDT